MAYTHNMTGTEEFRSKVRSIIHETMRSEEGIKDLLQCLKWEVLLANAKTELNKKAESDAKTQVELAISRQLPHQVSSTVSEKVATVLDAKERDLTTRLEKLLKAEAKSLIHDNAAIQGLLQHHHGVIQTELVNALEATKVAIQNEIREQLDRIVQEDRYQTINASLIRDLKEKVALDVTVSMSRMQGQVDSTLLDVRKTLREEIANLHTMENQITNATTLFTTCSDSTKANTRDIDGLKRHRDSTSGHLTFLYFWNAAVSVGLVWTVYRLCTK